LKNYDFEECGIHTEWEANLILNILPNDFNSVLDIGCGLGYWGFMLRTRIDRDFNLIGLDCYEPYIKTLKKMNIYDDLILLDLEEISELPFCDNCFDVSMSFHVIEHLKKNTGYMLINEIKRISKRKAIISCPSGDRLTVGKRLNDMIKEKKKPHVSCWDKKDFTENNFNVKVFDTKKTRKAIWLSWYLFYLFRLIKFRRKPKEMLKIMVADYP